MRLSEVDPTFDDVQVAAERIEALVRRTPVLAGTPLDDMVGSKLLFKCENLQRAGAFKFRGACNAVWSLPDEVADRGVAAHSSGNHAAALALAASLRGIPAHVVMPEDAPRAKFAAVAAAGGHVVRCAPTLTARAETLAHVLAETGATEVHPYDDPVVIAGAGTAVLELLADHPDLDAVVAPVSGGGLLSGTAVAVKGVDPGIAVFGAEPDVADDAARSLQAGRRVDVVPGRTIADGLVATLSDRTFGILNDTVADIVTVTDDEVVAALRLVWEQLKLVVEPSAAAAVAALLARPHSWPGRVGVILSGGNLDLDRLPF